MTLRAFQPLVPRGEAGVSCDDGGVALSGVPLVMAWRDGTGFVRYHPRTSELRRLFDVLEVPTDAAENCVADVVQIARSMAAIICWHGDSQRDCDCRSRRRRQSRC